MKTNYLLLAFALILSSCNNSKTFDENEIIGSWKLSTVSTLDDELVSKNFNFHFFPDLSYTTLEDKNVKYGKWSYPNENDNEINFGDNTLTIEEKNEENSKRSLIVNLYNKKDNTTQKLTLVEGFTKLKDFKKDPFYSANNAWRTKPSKKETNEEIRSRLLNYLLHNAYLLQAAHERNDGTISFTHSKGIIKIFQGGIGIVKESKINKNWINSFYDEEDAMKAFYLFSSHLDKQGIARAKTSGDWVKDDYGVLMTLHSKIQEAKSVDVARFLSKNSKKAYVSRS